MNSLEHLSETQVETLIERYYGGESVKNLLAEFQISVLPAKLYTLFPPEICKNEVCKYCGSFLIRNRLSKTAGRRMRDNADMYCPTCGHKPFAHPCKCDNCIREAQTIREAQEQKIKNFYARERKPLDFADLSFEQRVCLGTLCHALGEEDMVEIRPYSGSNRVLAPTNELCARIYASLSEAQIISVSPTSPLEAFAVDDFPKTYYVYKVRYSINLLFPPDREALFTEILNPSYYSAEHEGEALALWKKIAIGECLEYLLFQLHNIRFDFTPGEKTKKILDILLNDFSVSQVYEIIWKSVAKTAKWYLGQNTTKRHAANYVISEIERYAERAKANGWNLRGYNRIRELPQSDLSQFFFNRVLGIGDLGFSHPPTAL